MGSGARKHGTTGYTGPLFDTLRELAQPPEGEATKAHVRVLFVVPESASAEATALLEEDHLPYVVKPFTFHDLLERVSDLLMETEAIGAPLRQGEAGRPQVHSQSRATPAAIPAATALEIRGCFPITTINGAKRNSPNTNSRIQKRCVKRRRSR